MATGGKKETGSNLRSIGTLKLKPDDLDPWGVVVVGDKLVITDWKSKKVHVYRRHDSMLMSSSVILESTPWGLCRVNDTDLCVAMWDGITLMSVQDSGLISRGKTFHLRPSFDVCHGVAAFRDNVVVSGGKDNTICWCVVSLQDGRHDNLHKVCGWGLSRLTTKKNMAYISCRADSNDDRGVYGFNLLNPSQPPYTYKHKGPSWPRGITVDDNGDLFVCDFNSNSIHHLTEKCQLVDIYTEGIPRDPWAIFWDSGILYVSSYESNVITLYRNPHQDPVIPAEVLRMDDKSVQLYKEALRDGTEKVDNIRVMVVGQYGVGKSTLTKRLLGQQVDLKKRESTEGIDVYIHRCKVSLETGEWIVQPEDSDHLTRLERLVKLLNRSGQRREVSEGQQHHGKSIDERNVTPDVNSDISSDDINAASKHTPASSVLDIQQKVKPSVSQSADFSIMKAEKGHGGEHASPQTITDTVPLSEGITTEEKNAMIEIIHMVKENADKLEKSRVEYATLGMWDFAGQYVFYTTHQTFLTSRAIYLVLTDLSQQLVDDVKDDEFFFDINGKRECTVYDLVDVWLNSIHSCTPSRTSSRQIMTAESETVSKPRRTNVPETGMSEITTESVTAGTSHETDTLLTSTVARSRAGIPTTPPVILVGTHADKLPEFSRLDKTKKYFKELRLRLKDKPTRSHLADTDFIIDNTQCDPNLEALKMKIVELAKQQPYWGEEVPARWLPLEQVLMKLKASGIKIVRYVLVEKLNQEGAVPLQTKELDLFLRFQHEMGTILYFSADELKDKIILEPQWLINALKSLITAEDFIIMKYPAIMDKWCEFRDKGKLTLELIDAIWANENKEFIDNKSHILHLMEKLNIIARPRSYRDGKEVKEDYYLAPCMLREATPKELISPELHIVMESTSVLCFECSGKFLPPPVFHRLLSACLTRWPIATKKTENLIYCGCCLFELDLHHRMTLYFKDYVIFARVRRMGVTNKSSSSEVCSGARKFICENLSRITENLGQSLQFETHIKCPESDAGSVDGLVSMSALQDNALVPCHSHEETHILESRELTKFWFEDKELSAVGDTDNEMPMRLVPSSDKNEKPHQKVLNRCWPELVRDLDLNAVSDYIIQKDIFDVVTMRDILEQKTEPEKTRELLKRIHQRDQETYVKFKDCLILAKQEDLKIMLEKEEATVATGVRGKLETLVRDRKPTVKSILKSSFEEAVTRKGHVMISYDRGQQDKVLWIKSQLEMNGYTVWMDLENMGQELSQSMAEAVEKAHVVLVCMSQRYKSGSNCKKEATYAAEKKKLIFPLKMERNFTSDGWLGLLISDLKFYDFSGKYPIEKEMRELLSELAKCYGKKFKDPRIVPFLNKDGQSFRGSTEVENLSKTRDIASTDKTTSKTPLPMTRSEITSAPTTFASKAPVPSSKPSTTASAAKDPPTRENKSKTCVLM